MGPKEHFDERKNNPNKSSKLKLSANQLKKGDTNYNKNSLSPLDRRFKTIQDKHQRIRGMDMVKFKKNI